MQTYIDAWPLFSLMFGAIGMYLMSVTRSLKGLWERTSAYRLTVRCRFELGRLRRHALAAAGRPVQVLPAHVLKRRGRAVTIRDRVYVFPKH